MNILKTTARTKKPNRKGLGLTFLSGADKDDVSLFLYLGQGAPAWVNWATKGKDGKLHIQIGSLSDFVRVAETKPVVFVPGVDVLLSEVKIPAGKRSRAIQSAPFLMEEDLADDVEALHFSYGNESHEKMTGVAVVARETMTGWLDLLSEAGVEPRAIIPAQCAAPEVEDTITVVVSDQECLVRGDRDVPVSVDPENLDLVVGLAEGDGAVDERPSVVIYADEEKGDELKNLLPGCKFEQVSSSFMETIAKGYKHSSAIDLLHGSFSKSGEWRNIYSRYQLIFILMIVLLGVWGVGFGLDYSGLSVAEKQLDAKMRSVFLEAFPKSKRTDNPRMRMESRLKALRLKETKGDVFFMIYDQVVPVISQTKGSVISIRFKDGRFDFDMEVDSLKSLDVLKEQLGSNDRVKVDIRNASASGNKVRAVMQVMAGNP